MSEHRCKKSERQNNYEKIISIYISKRGGIYTQTERVCVRVSTLDKEINFFNLFLSLSLSLSLSLTYFLSVYTPPLLELFKWFEPRYIDKPLFILSL